MEVDKGSDQKSDIQPHWMAGHARLKNEFTEDEKCHNLMRWLKYFDKEILWKQGNHTSEEYTRLGFTYELEHEKTCLMSYTNNKGADQSAHPRSLISAFVVHCLDRLIV